MYKRWQETKLERALQSRRVVILSGARQCGKTTTVRKLGNRDYVYRTLDDVTLLKACMDDPDGFIKINDKSMIIGEVQKVTELILSIKKQVDKDTRYGQFLITGSVNIQASPTVRESLAGRVKYVRLRPLTQGEILGNSPTFLTRLINKNFIDNTGYDKRQCLRLIFDGGYPEVLSFDSRREKNSWYKDYVKTILEHDLKEISNITRFDNLKKIIEVIASYSSKFIDKTSLSTNCGVSTQAVDNYITVLENTYLIDKLHPWLKTDYERVNKRSKYFVTDTGLMSSLLKWKESEVLLNSDRSGKIFETYVYNQIISQIENSENYFELYHYRDREKREIDFLIQDEDDSIYGIEVKSGSNVSKESFKHLSWFKENLAKDKKFVGIVLYTGDYISSFGKDLYAVPINNLWE